MNLKDVRVVCIKCELLNCVNMNSKKESTNTGNFYKISSLIKIEDYSSLRKLLFVSSWVLRFYKESKIKVI